MTAETRNHDVTFCRSTHSLRIHPLGSRNLISKVVYALFAKIFFRNPAISESFCSQSYLQFECLCVFLAWLVICRAPASLIISVSTIPSFVVSSTNFGFWDCGGAGKAGTRRNFFPIGEINCRAYSVSGVITNASRAAIFLLDLSDFKHFVPCLNVQTNSQLMLGFCFCDYGSSPRN